MYKYIQISNYIKTAFKTMVKICTDNYSNESKYSSHFDLFPYELSSFQKYSIEAIVEGHHVLVCAPTGSGKTLPAEFAIDYFTRLGKKVIYTSPIKALSNQKYYDFSLKFPHLSIGLYTGDIKTNPNADLILMTAEILTNRLFNLNQTTKTKSNDVGVALDFDIDIETELGAVIMDEVHYINDESRGHTWEQTIMMLPTHIQMIMLSATLDGPEKFAKWIEDSKRTDNVETNKQVYLAATSHRIVPLTHYAYIAATESFLKLVKDKSLQHMLRQNTNKLICMQTDKNVFQEGGYKQVASILEIYEQREVEMKRKFILNNLATYLREETMLPAIFFVFSRKQVEMCAQEITANLLEDDSKIPYTMARECEAILRRLPNFEEYLALPEYQILVKLLEKGVAIHHSGMIPVLREIVELMITRGCVKVLFATESFSIGLNCPIKTAVFTGLTKFDGNQSRYLYAHEYTQMAGRAGRRGIDTIGHVIHLSNLFPLPTANEYKTILCGKSQTLVSKFHIDYSMVLSLLKKGKTANFEEFAEKSMISDSIEKKVNAQKRIVDQLRDTYLQKTELKQKSLRTDESVCLKFIELEERLKYSVNKKRKEVEREMQRTKDDHKWILQDTQIVKDHLRLGKELAEEIASLESQQSFIRDQTRLVCHILLNMGFIEQSEQKEYRLSEVGKTASYINEMHPLIIAKCFHLWDSFSQFSVYQIIGYLSIFCDIKVAEEMRVFEPKSRDKFLLNRIEETRRYMEDLQQEELHQQVYMGQKYGGFTYDLVDDMVAWSSLEDENACKEFIGKLWNDRGISVGDFVKAVLKICASAKELAAICEYTGLYTDLHYKLVQIEKKMLKYIATTQSLYV